MRIDQSSEWRDLGRAKRNYFLDLLSNTYWYLCSSAQPNSSNRSLHSLFIHLQFLIIWSVFCSKFSLCWFYPHWFLTCACSSFSFQYNSSFPSSSFLPLWLMIILCLSFLWLCRQNWHCWSPSFWFHSFLYFIFWRTCCLLLLSLVHFSDLHQPEYLEAWADEQFLQWNVFRN